MRQPLIKYYAQPNAIASAPVIEPWKDAYANFLREKIQTDNREPLEGSDEQARYSAFMAGRYPTVPFFYLYDIVIMEHLN
ncbi:MAG TPA: hypothetical protein PLZ84_04185 [Clostridia bacterium]|nr:hypothetical protein [Clostridia bacterium]